MSSKGPLSVPRSDWRHRRLRRGKTRTRCDACPHAHGWQPVRPRSVGGTASASCGSRALTDIMVNVTAHHALPAIFVILGTLEAGVTRVHRDTLTYCTASHGQTQDGQLARCCCHCPVPGRLSCPWLLLVLGCPSLCVQRGRSAHQLVCAGFMSAAPGCHFGSVPFPLTRATF